MAVQEALILPLRAPLPSSCFTQVFLTLSLSVCQSYLPLSPLSSPLIDSALRLPFVCALNDFLSLRPLISCSFLPFPLRCFPFSASPRILQQPGKVGYSFYYTQKRFCFSLLACSPGSFFLLFPTCLFARSPSLPFPLPGWGARWARDSDRQSGGKWKHKAAKCISMNIRDVVKTQTRFSLSLSLSRSLTQSLSLSLSLCKEVGQQMVLAVITLTFTTLTPEVLEFSHTTESKSYLVGYCQWCVLIGGAHSFISEQHHPVKMEEPSQTLQMYSWNKPFIKT